MNSITALKLAGLGDVAGALGRGVKGVFNVSGDVGADLGKLVGAEGLGRMAGYAAPVLGANYLANQYAPTRRAKVWLGEQLSAAGPRLGQALVPNDFGTRPGDY